MASLDGKFYDLSPENSTEPMRASFLIFGCSCSGFLVIILDNSNCGLSQAERAATVLLWAQKEPSVGSEVKCGMPGGC